MIEENRNSMAPLPVRDAAKHLGVSRSGYYRWKNREPPPEPSEDQLITDEIRDIIVEFAGYGYRRVTHELLRRKIKVNHKRVLRLMQEAHLTVKRKRYTPQTTDSSHEHTVYPNLTQGFETRQINQVWGSDITYIRLPDGYVYLAVIEDLYSRRIIGWDLGRGLDNSLIMNALLMALDTRRGDDLTGLIHHSDQGRQYASVEYTECLKDNGIQISMSRKGNPYDNAFVESFFKTLKTEEVYLNEYETFGDAYTNIEQFMEEVYNKKRLHSSLGYKTPLEFENEVVLYTQA
jgi:transposase InsO family protein